MSRAAVAGRGLLLAVLALVLAGCGMEYPQSSVDPKSDFAQSIHFLYVLIFWITLVILVLTWGAMTYIMVKFRARPDSPKPRQIHGHLGMELAWTVIPAIIVVAIAIPTIQTVFRTQRPAGPDTFMVDVIGHQFWWEFRYPDGTVTANDLRLPVGVPVALRLHSVDVIHSFWVPQLGGKRDVNPLVAPPGEEEAGETSEAAEDPAAVAAETGRYNYLYFTISEPGIYRGQCAEFCGSSHSLMGVRVIAQTPDEFEQWLASWRGPAVDTTAADSAVVQAAGEIGGGGAARIELGRQTFHSASCVACHAIQGTSAAGRVGPDLTLYGQRQTVAGWLENTPDNLVRWITAPQSVKPNSKMPGSAEAGGNFPPTNLSEEQVRAVAEYLWSLGK